MDDLIKRQAAIDAVRELYIQSPKINNDIVYDTAIDQAHDALVNLPSAQPQRKMGKWTVKEGELGFWDVCSVCRKIIFHKTPLYNFCPNCGADMRNADEIARDIMHEAIEHSVWSDTVNVDEMHRVVNDKYADMRGEQDG